MNPKFVYSSIMIEIVSFFLFLGMRSPTMIFSALALHGVALVLVVSALVNLLPERFEKTEKLKSVAIFSTILYPTLYIGYIAVVVMIVYIIRKQKVSEYTPFMFFSVEEFLDESFQNRQKLRSFGEGALISISKAEKINKSLKEKAMLALSDLKNPKMFKLLKESLSSDIDEVRLFAFSIVSKLEKKFNDNLHRLKERLNEENLSTEEKAEIYYQIAKQYYDFVYYNVVDEEFRKFMLQEAINYCSISLKLNESIDAYLLLGKLYNEIGLLEIGYNYLLNVQEYSKLNPVEYVPVVADMYFRFGMFKDIVELFKKYPELELLNDIEINFALRFWMDKDEGVVR